MILVTAFEPYDGSFVNPSEQVLTYLPKRIHRAWLRKTTLPCDCQVAPKLAEQLACKAPTALVLILGEDRRYSVPTLESSAYNCMNYETPDNAGNQPRGRPIVESGPHRLATRVNTAKVQKGLAVHGVALDVSDDPGRHLCNHVYFTLLLMCSRSQRPNVVMLHLPRLPEQGTQPCAPLETSLTTTQRVLDYLATREIM